jgi:glucosamine--fructose-6-phosphate aminotransferase (isomerizing)
MKVAKQSGGSGTFEHFMLKEIYDQPQAIRDTINRHVDADVIFPAELLSIENALLSLKKIIIAASGSSRHAGLAGEIMIEDLSGISVDVEYASEYCYRSTHAGTDPLVMVITQSGETADTIAAQREALVRGAKTVAISNVEDSTIAREASAGLLTCAAPEVSIPATKSFTSQLTVLYLFALFLARKRGRITSEVLRGYLARLTELPDVLQSWIPLWDTQAAECASTFRAAEKYFYLGRGVHYAIAREGALKLKEVSYANAEGYPTGELKHGPSALIDEQMVVVALATHDARDPDSVLRYRKTLGILEEVKLRRGKIITIATEGDKQAAAASDFCLFVPPAPELLLPILEIVPLQLFAYHVAVLSGAEIDNPRNLVKSVTRE